jgi:hypothetical protein
MSSADLATFHRWFFAGRTSRPPSIIIHGEDELPMGFEAAVARHLNQFDEDASGCWMSFPPELVEQIAASPVERLLLGLYGECNPTSPDCERREVISALAAHGQAVMGGDDAMQSCSEKENIFRAWLGSPPGCSRSLHIILEPRHFAHRSLSVIIGDTFLEWTNANRMN